MERNENGVSLLSDPPYHTGTLDLTSVSTSILFVTDNEFYFTQSNWVADAQILVAKAYNSFNRGDIKVVLDIAGFDISKKNDFSNDPRRFTNPWDLCDESFNDQYLNNKGADIVMYLGGYDRVGNDIGEGDWPTSRGRAAWMQMVCR